MFLTDPIVFPHLGITLDPAPAAFSIGGKAIYWYGIIIAVGFLLAYAYMSRRAPLYGCTSDDALDAVLWAVPIGVICARPCGSCCCLQGMGKRSARHSYSGARQGTGRHSEPVHP